MKGNLRTSSIRNIANISGFPGNQQTQARNDTMADSPRDQVELISNGETTTSDPGDGPSTSTPDHSGSQLSVRVRRKPIPRKGHTKSRRGCYNCKSRKVKCQENVPICLNCSRIGLVCEYPEPAQVLIRRPAPAPLPSPEPPIQAIPAPTMFSVDDLRFFHHFVVTAYPPLPIKRGDIWRNVAAISYDVGSPFILSSPVHAVDD